MSDNCIDQKAIEALHELGGNELVSQMIDSFLAYLPKVLTEARKGLANGNLDPVLRMGHTLRSSGRNLGAMRIVELAQAVESAGRASQLPRLPALLDEMEQAFFQAKDCLEEQRSRLVV